MPKKSQLDILPPNKREDFHQRRDERIEQGH